jgi:putative Mg2+ transporter-C (MgtC) family protein
MPSQAALILRLAVGAALGAAIGFERDRHGRRAGMRTHLLVALASATFMVVSAHFYFFQGYGGAAGVVADPSRIAASVVTGIGFLAGGAILKTGLNVQGLTTAAGLWLVAAIGLCAGAGMYVEALAVTAMGLAALTLLRALETKDDRMLRREVTLLLRGNQAVLQTLFITLGEAGVQVSDFAFERPSEVPTVTVTFLARVPATMGPCGFIALLEQQSEVQGIKVRVPP